MAEGSNFVRRDRRQKAAHSRSRTGCVTCKERHLRCDEGKPTCEQCRKSGRQCGGYTQVERNTGKRRHGYMTIRGFRHTFFPGPENAINQDSRPRQDKRAFAFFRQRTLEVIQSCFPPQAWHLDALKLSYSVPAISHILVAIATLDELQVKPSHLPISESEKASNPSYNAIKMLALQHYTKALSLTSASIEEKNLSSGTALLICLLFIIYETLNGSRASISAHLNNGVKLLRGTPDDGSDLEGMQITSAFRRISLHHALLGRPRSLSVPWLTTLKAPSSTSGYSFHDIQQARISLETLISSTLQLICAVRWTGCQVTRKMRQMQNDIRHQLSLWRAAFVELSDHMTLQESTSAKLLYLHYISISVYLESCTENETFCDRFEATFQEVVDLSRSLIIEESVPGLLGPDAVLFEGALLSPLLSVAIKCRNSKIRREALRLLRLAPRREGYWDAVECSKIAEVVIDFEENRAATAGNGASGIIQENDRVLNIDLGDVDMKDGMPKTAILMLKPNGCEAEFVQISLYDT